MELGLEICSIEFKNTENIYFDVLHGSLSFRKRNGLFGSLLAFVPIRYEFIFLSGFVNINRSLQTLAAFFPQNSTYNSL